MSFTSSLTKLLNGSDSEKNFTFDLKIMGERINRIEQGLLAQNSKTYNYGNKKENISNTAGLSVETKDSK